MSLRGQGDRRRRTFVRIFKFIKDLYLDTFLSKFKSYWHFYLLSSPELDAGDKFFTEELTRPCCFRP
jgi:hypothetical protein